MSDLQPGPCIVCGRTNYPLSAGGPTICPRCDVGFSPELAGRLAREVEELRKNLDVELDLNTHLVGRIEELRAALEQLHFSGALLIAQDGFNAWKAKPHNAKWFKRIDGTPIPNDLLVNIAEAIAAFARAALEEKT